MHMDRLHKNAHTYTHTYTHKPTHTASNTPTPPINFHKSCGHPTHNLQSGISNPKPQRSQKISTQPSWFPASHHHIYIATLSQAESIPCINLGLVREMSTATRYTDIVYDTRKGDERAARSSMCASILLRSGSWSLARDRHRRHCSRHHRRPRTLEAPPAVRAPTRGCLLENQ